MNTWRANIKVGIPWDTFDLYIGTYLAVVNSVGGWEYFGIPTVTTKVVKSGFEETPGDHKELPLHF